MREEAKAPAYSASATIEQTTGMRVEWDEIGWLSGALSSMSPRRCVPTGDTAGRRAGEVRGVREAAENHLGRSVDLSSVGVDGGVAEETVETGHGVGGGVRLLGRKSAGGGQEAGIYGTTVV